MENQLLSSTRTWAVQAGWRILMRDLGLDAERILRRARLPEDLFVRESTRLSSEEYFRLWSALEEEADDPLLPLRIGGALSVEAFDPPIFAALCSRNLIMAIRRLSRFKRLLAPIALRIEEQSESVSLRIDWLEKMPEPPSQLVTTDLVFFVQLARLATRAEIRPLRVTTPRPPEPSSAYTDYFGIPIEKGEEDSLVFSRTDAERPFLTSNDAMWHFFEPELRQRLSQLDASATMADRVRSVLLELLPAGTASMDFVSSRLALSKRTLQRRLSSEGGSFQRILDQTRLDLARHYLRTTQLSGAEISYLLGYEDANSFFRAFHVWTGETPERARQVLRTAN